MIQYQILQTNITRTIWQTVRRITNEILGVKGLRKDMMKTKIQNDPNFLNYIVKEDNLIFPFRGKKCEKKIYLFSDLGSPFGNDQLETITEGLKSLQVHLTLM